MCDVRTLIVALLVGACACSHEVSRVPSPSGKAAAVLVETNGGATTSFGYEVYVLPEGASWRWADRAAFLYGTTRNDSAYGANLRWVSSDLVRVEYLQSQSAAVERPSTKVGDLDVRVELRGGIEDPSAPPDSMLYNLEGRPYDQAPN